MPYIEKLLGADETILIETRRHLFVLLTQLIKEFIILAVLIVGWVVIRAYDDFLWLEIALAAIAGLVVVSMLIDWIRWKNEAYFITNRRVIQTNGVFNKKTLDSSVSKINDVILEQSFFGRMFDYGTIKILTATEEVINRLDRIAGPLEFKKAMLGAKASLEPISAAPSQTHGSPAQLLEDLAQMKAKNLISEEEYNEKRKEILKRM
jgi:uncharacterized membrane protein YdbT with pleckstrin-like domain